MDTTAQQRVAAEVRAHMARKRWSGRRMAMQLGWKQPYIGRRLAGDVPFDVNDLVAIAGVLEIPVTAFFAEPAGGGQLRKQLTRARHYLGLAA